MKFKFNQLLAFLSLLPMSAMASEPLSIERIFSSPSLEGEAPMKLKVSPDGERISFLKGKTSDYERYDLWEYHIESGQTRLLVDADSLHSGPEDLSEEEKARRERLRLHGSGIVDYFWSEDGSALLFPLAGDAYYYNLSEQKVRPLLQTPEFETDIRFSPKGNYISYIREQNLYVMDIATGQEKRLTNDGGGNIKYGMAEFVAQEEMGRMTGYWWAADEANIALTRVDESPVEEVTRSEIYADKVDVITQRYPAAGKANVLIELGVINLDSGETKWLDMGDDKDIYLARVNWLPGSRNLTYQWQSRNQKRLELRKVEVATGIEKVLLAETSHTWINLHDDLRFFRARPQFIWASERAGFKHLYLYDTNGELLKQLTSGDWVVDEINAIDEAKNLVYFTGRKDSPIERHLYRLSLADGEIKRISQLKGTHAVSFDKKASVYVDRFSSVNTPPQVSLHKADGTRLAYLEENAVNEQHPLGPYRAQWVQPEFGTIAAEDGTPLHYRLYTPKQVSGKHPAIVYLYGGPGAQLVTNSWGGPRGLVIQHWVNKGYVVFTLDNRGSDYRGKAFEDAIYRKLGELEVSDQVQGVRFLRTLPYVDGQRIGVYGHSYGGYMALMSMFKAGDYFKAGVSGAPVTDWALYDTHYTERYLDHPKDNAEGYTASAVFPYAKDLKGELLIYHGMADDNVLFSHSTRLYKLLQDNMIPFQMMDYPGKKHGLRGKETSIHLYQTITRFFDRNL
ncbi:DPP IV N-terminal domain-containing protein [Aliiglaciecola sp. CAU 1673]|uniref:S9 family peptidase n=1 Tax=Aliiglaciecola sp. CAU 1673 TaxID=3032595 RepID=UPI0023DC708E|nr:DPP IV N-terminal domain-containing protein [Aliiglaciecola sp. CAU 1673]MDF2176834.1 DPP IV N-terminal domain-containing protein [Aliiglaciecola sp. CAU 1673]